jgi:hypothetical protein
MRTHTLQQTNTYYYHYYTQVELTPYKELHCGVGVVPRCLTRGGHRNYSAENNNSNYSAEKNNSLDNDPVEVEDDHYLILDSAVGGGLRMLPLAPSHTTTASGTTIAYIL